MAELLGNQFATILTAPALATDTTLKVAAVPDGLPSGSFRCLLDAGTVFQELVQVTGVSGLTLTVIRAVEPVAGAQMAVPHAAGTAVQIVLTAGGLTAYVAQQIAASLSGLVTSFNTRVGAVVLQTADIVAALGFTPISAPVLNTQLANSSITITTSTGISGGGTVALGGSLTLTNIGVTNATNSDGSITLSSSTGSVTYSLATGHSNTWSVGQLILATGVPIPFSVRDSSSAGVVNPYLTADNAPSPYVASASAEVNSQNQAWNAFNGVPAAVNSGSKWEAGAAPPQWLQIDLSRTTNVTAYSIVGCIGGQTGNAPKSWTLQGSPDGSTWTTLDTQTNAPAWSALEQRTYTLGPLASYRYYRLSITASQGGGDITIVQLILLGQGTNILSCIEGEVTFLDNQVVFREGMMALGPGIADTFTISSAGASVVAVEATGGGNAVQTLITTETNSNGVFGSRVQTFGSTQGWDFADLLLQGYGHSAGFRMEGRSGQPILGSRPEIQFGPIGSPVFACSSAGAWVQSAQTQVNGSGSGTVMFAQPFGSNDGASFGKVLAYCAALNGTATYNFPNAFAHKPAVVYADSGLSASLSASSVTITGSTATGWVILEGF